ncbi:hypothetical protein ACPUEN_04445 [Algoriphagus yeomjeoni]|uniref:hypothetical protein n=1 Tax=Algoriphagus yeomjeoni TaxID=291403 RepID=UPI003CE48995
MHPRPWSVAQRPFPFVASRMTEKPKQRCTTNRLSPPGFIQLEVAAGHFSIPISNIQFLFLH